MKIIPAIDLIGGQCVRLTQGNYSEQTVYHTDPLEVAKVFDAHHLRYLHLVDLDGAKAGKVQNFEVLERIAKHTNLHIDFSGGISSDEDIKKAFDLGAKQVTIGSLAVKAPHQFLTWVERFGTEKIILAADVKHEQVVIRGWQEKSHFSIFSLLEEYQGHGIQEVICTDVAKDGMLVGPSLELYQEILKQFPTLKLIASGGVHSIHDLELLKTIGCHGVIIGKALYEGKIQPHQLASYA